MRLVTKQQIIKINIQIIQNLSPALQEFIPFQAVALSCGTPPSATGANVASHQELAVTCEEAALGQGPNPWQHTAKSRSFGTALDSPWILWVCLRFGHCIILQYCWVEKKFVYHHCWDASCYY